MRDKKTRNVKQRRRNKTRDKIKEYVEYGVGVWKIK